MPKVSILIPVYNRVNYIEETIRSACNQTFSDIEVIVIDNKSTDGTWECLSEIQKTDSRIRIFQNEINIGPVRNWKRCIEEMRGEYGKILWSDDKIASEFVEAALAMIESNDVGFVYSATQIFNDETGGSITSYDIGDDGVYDSESYIKGVLISNKYPVSPGCALFRAEDLKKNLLVDIENNIDIDFSMHAIGNDLLLFLLTLADYKYFGFIKEPMSFFRDHKGSISSVSNDGKLQLFYDLAKAYFAERYRPEYIKLLNASIYIDLKRFSAGKYNIEKIDDFYTINKCFEVGFLNILKVIVFNIKVKFDLG